MTTVSLSAPNALGAACEMIRERKPFSVSFSEDGRFVVLQSEREIPPARPIRLAIVLEGGLVQAIVSDAVWPELDVITIDYDIDDPNDDNAVYIRQDDGSKALAWVNGWSVEKADDGLDELFKEFGSVEDEAKADDAPQP